MLFRKNKKRKIVRQSNKHLLVKSLMSEVKVSNKETQFTKRSREKSIRTIVLDGIAYWIKDNVFYMSETINDVPNPNTAKPVDIENMPKKELDKMLFILDNLKRGDLDDSGSSRNWWF